MKMPLPMTRDAQPEQLLQVRRQGGGGSTGAARHCKIFRHLDVTGEDERGHLRLELGFPFEGEGGRARPSVDDVLDALGGQDALGPGKEGVGVR